MALMKRRFLFEADDDDAGNDTSADTSTDDTSTDDSSDNDTDNTDDTNDDDSTDDNADDSDDEDSDEDYSIDAEPDESDQDDDDSGDGDDSSDDSYGDDSGTDSEEKELDRSLFDTLTDKEKQNKINTLKQLYIELYGNCDALTDRFNQITTDDKNEEFNPVIKRILGVLYQLKGYLSYYVTNVFDDKSYIENDVNFNRYLSVLNGIKLAAQGLQDIHEKEEEKKPKADKDTDASKTATNISR